MLAYRPSISSVDRSQLDPAEAVIKIVELHFKVDRDGRVDEVTSPTTDVPENIVRNSMSSMKRSRYAPRIENGVGGAHRKRGVLRTGAGQSDVARNWDGEEAGGAGGSGDAGGVVATTGWSLIGTASMVMSATAAAASGEPGAGFDFGVSACEASSGLASSSPWNCVRNFAAASRMAA